MATPLRDLDLPLSHDACRILGETDVGHLDGAEGAIRRILFEASDRSSLSDELAAHDETSWQTRYHLSHERANIVRALSFPREARVLEIGAGCGAITRYLGETCALVDAIEPKAERAAIARLRCQELEGVEIYAGDLDAVPREAAYDAVVIVGVLEYVGGSDGVDERLRFLREARARLRPGGFVACAIENRFGVQYLCGAREEHLGEPFVGLEGYLVQGPARTFSRRELEHVFEQAGLTPAVHHVFPDYKFARLIYADALVEGDAQPLAWRAPAFPSDGTPHVRPRLASEGHVWRGLVEAGLGGYLANSFLVVGRPDEMGASPWPERQQAVMYALRRRAAFAVETRIVGDGGSILLHRRRLAPQLEAKSGSLEHRCVGGQWKTGAALMEILERTDSDEQLSAWLGRWRDLVSEARTPVDVDLVPHNVIVHDDRLVVVDEEWLDSTWTPRMVVARGVLQAALSLAERCPPTRWRELETIGDVVDHIAVLLGVPDGEAELDATIEREAELLTRVSRVPAGDAWERSLTRRVRDLRELLRRPLDTTPLGARENELRGRFEGRAHELHLELDRVFLALADRDATIRSLEARLDTAKRHPRRSPVKAGAPRIVATSQRLARSVRRHLR